MFDKQRPQLKPWHSAGDLFRQLLPEKTYKQLRDLRKQALAFTSCDSWEDEAYRTLCHAAGDLAYAASKEMRQWAKAKNLYINGSFAALVEAWAMGRMFPDGEASINKTPPPEDMLRYLSPTDEVLFALLKAWVDDLYAHYGIETPDRVQLLAAVGAGLQPLNWGVQEMLSQRPGLDGDAHATLKTVYEWIFSDRLNAATEQRMAAMVEVPEAIAGLISEEEARALRALRAHVACYMLECGLPPEMGRWQDSSFWDDLPALRLQAENAAQRLTEGLTLEIAWHTAPSVYHFHENSLVADYYAANIAYWVLMGETFEPSLEHFADKHIPQLYKQAREITATREVEGETRRRVDFTRERWQYAYWDLEQWTRFWSFVKPAIAECNAAEIDKLTDGGYHHTNAFLKRQVESGAMHFTEAEAWKGRFYGHCSAIGSSRRYWIEETGGYADSLQEAVLFKLLSQAHALREGINVHVGPRGTWDIVLPYEGGLLAIEPHASREYENGRTAAEDIGNKYRRYPVDRIVWGETLEELFRAILCRAQGGAPYRETIFPQEIFHLPPEPEDALRQLMAMAREIQEEVLKEHVSAPARKIA